MAINRNSKRFKEKKVNVLIICAKTEKKYLKAYFKKKPLPKDKKITFYKGKANTPSKKYYNKLINGLNERYKYIYHIFDLENPENGSFKSMLEYVKECKKEGLITPILQMPSIEVWFLLHFMDNIKEFKNATDAYKKLQKHFKEYNKNKTPCWNKVLDKTEKAIKEYKFQKSTYTKLEGGFKQHNITNPMMQIGDLLQKLPNLKL